MNDPEFRNATASAWMKRGITLLNENTSSSVSESLSWFERAIDLRRSLPLETNPWYRYVLAAGWMNRADALTRLAEAANLSEAVRSYDEALALLKTLDLASDTLFRRRLALAWMNRGITLQAQGTVPSFSAAVESFSEAIALSRDSSLGAEMQSILACSLVNHGNALLALTPCEPTKARTSAEEALTLVSERAQNDLLAAETDLKARHVLCRAIAAQLSDQDATIVPHELIGVATDAVEDGMRLARHWERRGEIRFCDLADDLFRFGMRVYQRHQPHFMMEFLLENLDLAQSSDAPLVHPQLHAIAEEAVAQGFRQVQREGFQAVNTPRFERFLETVRQLRKAEERLGALRRNRPLLVS